MQTTSTALYISANNSLILNSIAYKPLFKNRVTKKQSTRAHIASSITNKLNFVFAVLMQAQTINSFISATVAVDIIAACGSVIPKV
jgi:hypothetical protein